MVEKERVAEASEQVCRRTEGRMMDAIAAVN